MIGLYDWDLITWQQPIVFNLELMKYARKIRNERQLVRAIDDISDERILEILVFKEYEDSLYPANFVEDPRITFLGRAVSEESMYNEEIVNLRPDTSIYKPLKKYYKTNRELDFYNKMMRAIHIRLLDKNGLINEKWKRNIGSSQTIKTLIFHDKDITETNDSYKEIKEYTLQYPNVFVGFKYPIEVADEDELYDWLSLPLSRNLRNIRLSFTPNSAHYLRKERGKADFFFNTNHLNKAELFLMSLFLISNGNTVEWVGEDVLNQYFVYYSRERNKAPESFFSYVKHRQIHLTKEEKVSLFQDYKEQDETLFNYLYIAEYVSYEEGNLVPKMYTNRERRERR